MDPLSALRDYTIRGDLDKIHRAGTEFRFGADYTFPCTIDTAYRSKQGNLYTLETLIYFINNHHLRHTDYLQSARTRGIPAVTFIDRKPLLDYLHGRAASSDAIELFLPPQNAAVAAAGNDEYRPEEPQFLSVHSNAATGGAENDGFDVGVDLGSEVRVLETLDYTGLIRASERPLRDREEVLQCRNRDFYSVYISALKREEERQRVESHQRKDGLVAKNRLMAGEERGRGYREEGFDSGSKGKRLKVRKIGEGVPIILVPSASSTLITIYNVKEFLEDGVFIPMDVKMKQMKGPKPECVTVQKKFSRDRDKVVTAYEVRDKPSIMKPEDWDRVVAAFVLGKEWQFKDWPFKDHVEIFNKIIGFFMRFEDDSIESARNVKQWNVKIISISKNKRHQDRAAALEVWDKLEEFMRSRSHS